MRLLTVLLSTTVLLFAGCDDAGEDLGASLEVEPGTIEIIIDSKGVPHIFGATDSDVFYGYGYQLAKDRLFQLEMFRRRSQGRTAEVLGEEGVIPDQQAAIFNWRHWGKLDGQWMAEHEPERYALIEAYVAGINARVEEIRQGTQPRPWDYSADAYDFLPEPWVADDVFVIQKMAGFAQDLTLEFEAFLTVTNRFFGNVLDGIEIFKPARPAYGLPPADRASMSTTIASHSAMPWSEEPVPMSPRVGSSSELRGLTKIRGLGSNNWAVDGRHTDTGMPYLAGDPHMGIGYSGLLYAVHLNSKSYGGAYNTAGFAFVGAPGIAMGHNENVAWSPTSTFADVMDIWDVEITEEGALIGDTVVPVVEREERYIVRDDGQAMGRGREVILTVLEVPGYGLIFEPEKVGFDIPIATDGRYVLLGWTGFAQRSARYFLELNTVNDLDEFAQAVQRMGEMTYNLVAADKNGIRYQVGVDVPKRTDIAPGREPWLLMDGEDPASWWTGELLSKTLLPSSRGGTQGWITTANTDPFGFTADGQLHNDPFYYGAFFAPGWRASRIGSELSRYIEEGDVTLAQMQALQTDTHSNLADDLLPYVEAAWTSATTEAPLGTYADDEGIAHLVERLLNVWDRKMVRDSSDAALFHAFAHLLTEEVMGDDLPLIFPVVMSLQPVYFLKVTALSLQSKYSDGDHILQGGTHRIVLKALRRTARYFENRFGSLEEKDFKFGDIHFAEFDDGFGMGSELGLVAIDGGESTVNVSAGNFFEDGEIADRWVSDWIPMERMVATFNAAGQPQAWVNFPMGNVSEPDSPHFDNNQNDWLDGRYSRLFFDMAEVLANEESRYELKRP